MPNVFGCSDEEGNVSLINARTKEFLGHVRHPDSIFDLQFSHDDSLLLLASADEFTYIRRTEDLAGNPVMCLGHHQGTVRTARWHPSNPNLLVTAARDGDMAIWDLRTTSASPSHSVPVAIYSKIHNKIPVQKKQASNRTTVVQAEFIPMQDHLIATIGQPDHAIKFWDSRYKWGPTVEPVPVDQIRVPPLPGFRERSFTSFTPHPNGTSLFAANANNNVYEFSLSNFSAQPLQTFRAPGYEAGSFFVKLALSSCGEYLASGSIEDRTYVWSTNSKGSSCFKIGGHFKEVTSVAWSNGKDGNLTLLSCGEDGAINRWNDDSNALEMVGFGRPVHLAESLKISCSSKRQELTFNDASSEIEELRNLPRRQNFSSASMQENIRPITPPNLAIPTSLRSSCKKTSTISDFFRPVPPGLSITDYLISSHQATPRVRVVPVIEPVAAMRSEGLKQSVLNFCSSPLRPASKLVRRDTGT